MEDDPGAYILSGEIQVSLVSPPTYPFYRIARDPFTPTPWEHAHRDDEPQPGTFGGRFDDPSKQWGTPDSERFRVFYCARERACAFVESLQAFRVDLDRQTKISESLEEFAKRVNMSVHEDSSDAPFDPAVWPSYLRHWIDVKRIADTRFHDDAVAFVDLEDERTLQALSSIPALKTIAERYGYSYITPKAVRDAHRELTQAIAYALYQVGDESGRSIGGIRYMSHFSEASRTA